MLEDFAPRRLGRRSLQQSCNARVGPTAMSPSTPTFFQASCHVRDGPTAMAPSSPKL